MRPGAAERWQSGTQGRGHGPRIRWAFGTANRSRQAWPGSGDRAAHSCAHRRGRSVDRCILIGTSTERAATASGWDPVEVTNSARESLSRDGRPSSCLPRGPRDAPSQPREVRWYNPSMYPTYFYRCPDGHERQSHARWGSGSLASPPATLPCNRVGDDGTPCRKTGKLVEALGALR